MGRLSKVKRILDSVHGQIKIPKEWCEKIIDSTYFQRLRRIEQNSCRSVYPSARHDRFIHSLGVYHIGTLIVEHLIEECECLPENAESVFLTYRLACLLHDVGHTPFSHTFEEFYNEKQLRKELTRLLGDNQEFKTSLEAREKKLTEHELLSAFVAISVFRGILEDDEKIDWDLLIRMIIGLKYVDENAQHRRDKFENIMIELIHGTIDADGLDYVCRDAWAGGYHNFAIDLRRLIQSILITKSDNQFELSFSSKALNEIEGVLNIKNFQSLYVLNHHKVQLEQFYLKEAMKTAASYHTGIINQEDAIRKLCDYNSFIDEIELQSSHYKLYRPCDDDFVVLMKQMPHNAKIDGWFSRRFVHVPLWKSKMGFFETFYDILYNIPIPIGVQRNNESDTYLKNKRREIVEAICKSKCKEYVRESLNLANEDIIQIEIEPKFRRINPNEIKVYFNSSIKKYSDLSHDSFSVVGDETPYCYWYVDLTKLPQEQRDATLITQKIKEYLKISYFNQGD